jgi:hypothetical protein
MIGCGMAEVDHISTLLQRTNESFLLKLGVNAFLLSWE